MGLPPMHGSQNMNHIRLIDKLIYVQARYKYLRMISQQHVRRLRARRSRANNAKCAISNQVPMSYMHQDRLHIKRQRPMCSSSFRSSYVTNPGHKQNLTALRKALPIVSNMPLIHVNSSLILVNASPFGLRDPRFGILHHHPPSISYF